MITLKEGDICPECERGHLKPAVKDINFTCKGKVFFSEENMAILRCDLCDYKTFRDRAKSEEIEKALIAFREKM